MSRLIGGGLGPRWHGRSVVTSRRSDRELSCSCKRTSFAVVWTVPQPVPTGLIIPTPFRCTMGFSEGEDTRFGGTGHWDPTSASLCPEHLATLASVGSSWGL